MWQWLRKTRLAIQLQQISTAYRSLRQAEHRHSLRVKRAAVKSRILYEIHRKRLQGLGLQLLQAKLLKRVNLTKHIITAHETRDQKLAAVFQKHGLRMPEKTRPRGKGADEHGFKDRLFSNVEDVVGSGVLGKTLGREALEDSFRKVSVRGSEKDVAVGLVAGVAREIGLSRRELDDLFEVVERDGGDVGLRDAVLEALKMDAEVRK